MWWGFGQGSAHFVIIAPFMVFATGGVEAMSLALMARGTRLMSLLIGDVRTESGPIARDRVGKALGWHFIVP